MGSSLKTAVLFVLVHCDAIAVIGKNRCESFETGFRIPRRTDASVIQKQTKILRTEM